jgi:chemotaxis signal transduction protein
VLFEQHRLAGPVLAQPVISVAMPRLAPVQAPPEAAIKPAELSHPPVEAKAVQPPPQVAIRTRKGQDERSRTETARAEPAGGLSSRQMKEWLDNGRPVWAQSRFECLLFSVAGLTLAVPLVSLGAIYRLDRELTPLVGRASWFMGLFRCGERNVQVVDTAQWVMPDRWRPEVRDSYRFVIRLGEDNWGVASDLVQQAINLRPDEVSWRTERSRRPWLAGTVIEHMCALLASNAP